MGLKQLAKLIFAPHAISLLQQETMENDPRFLQSLEIMKANNENFNARIPADISPRPTDHATLKKELLTDIERKIKRDELPPFAAATSVYDHLVAQGPQNEDQTVINRFVASVRHNREIQRTSLRFSGGWDD